MVKSYLRYSLKNIFGLINSTGTSSRVVFEKSGTFAISPALESVAVQNLKQSLVTRLLRPDKSSAVSQIVENPTKDQIAVGYNDGSIRLWSILDGKCLVTLNGHHKAVCSLKFNSDGTLLVSGSRDTNIIVWDVVGEVGLYRLRGHQNEVTDVAFLEKSGRIVSSSKDGFVKLWEMETQHCVQTLTGHRSEVWCFVINSDETRLITGSADNQLRIWRLVNPSNRKNAHDAMDTSSDYQEPAVYLGSLQRSGRKRVCQLSMNSRGNLLFCLGVDKMIEVFRVRSDEEIRKKMKRGRKRKREKLKLQGKSLDDAKTAADSDEPTPTDIFSEILPLRAHHRISSFSILPNSSPVTSFTPQIERILVALSNNSILLYDLDLSDEENLFKRRKKIELAGHRYGVRSVCLSKDDTLIMTTSNDQVKIWNSRSQQCIQTLESGYGLCCAFAPGSRHAIIGTKEGNVEVYDLGAASLVQKVKAHDGAVWSLDCRANERGFATGGSDHTVKFWDYELVKNDSTSAKQLAIVHTRTLKVTDDVLSVKHSHNGKYIAISLLDSTVKVFYEDSLKFFLSLYGHRLPVLCLDISSDDTLLISGSADKNIKIFGLDFGDCHKSMFAHDNSVMQVKFVPNTHYFFSAGKDKILKYWDADKFEQIFVLNGHHAEIWGLCVSSIGDFIVSGSNDKSIRIWERTNEQVFLEEEREIEMEQLFEKDDQLNNESRPGAIEGSGLSNRLDGDKPSKSTKETLTAGDRLMEAIDLVEFDIQRWSDYDKALKASQERHSGWLVHPMDETPSEPSTKEPPVNPLLEGKTPHEYLIRQLKRIRAGDLEEALLLLTFNYATKLIKFLSSTMEKGTSIELTMKCVLILVKIHQNQIISDKSLLETLQFVRKHGKSHLKRYRDLIGCNVAALKHLQQLEKTSSSSYFFDERRNEN
uniref:WD40 repeat-like protein n=2 Tax=Hirondellea gigas TaxID=1518452 RepID=A0A6A7G9N2_9CRUS